MQLSAILELSYRTSLCSESWRIGKDPDAEKDWKQKEKGVAMRWLDSITNLVNMNLSKLWEIVEDRGAWRATVHGVAKSRTPLNDWTTTNLFRMSLTKFVSIVSLTPFFPQDLWLSTPLSLATVHHVIAEQTIFLFGEKINQWPVLIFSMVTDGQASWKSA